MPETLTSSGDQGWAVPAGVGKATTGGYTFEVANIQVVRVEKRRQLPAALLAHIDGRTRPVEARDRPELRLKPAVVLVDNVENARKALAAAKAVRRRGRPGTIECVDFLFAGPPPFASPDAWPQDRVDQWLQANLQWVSKCAGPRAVIAAASAHTDERSPHLHLLLVPIDARGRLSWKAVELGFAADPTAVGKQILRSLQDRYQKEVGCRFGLARGEVGSRRKHEPIDRRKGLVDRILAEPAKWSARQHAEAAQLRAEDADRERDRAEQQQREAEAQRARAVDAAASAEAARARAVAERVQAVARATAAEVKREAVKRSRSELLRERDEARKARDTEHQALNRERAARKAETADWKRKLEYAAQQLVIARQEWQKAEEEQRPPTQIAVDQAQAQVLAANRARERAESGRDKANEDWKRAYGSYLAEKQQCEAITAKRDQDIAAAREHGYKQGQDSGDKQVKAAVDRAAGFQVEIDALRERLPVDVEAARQEAVADGRVQRIDAVTALQQTVERLTTETADAVTALQQTVERLTTDLEAAKQHRERLIGDVNTLSEHRDDLQKRLMAIRPALVPPPRPRGPGRNQAEQDPARSQSTQNRS